MSAPPRRPPRWSKKTDELVQDVAQLTRPSLQSELGDWLQDNARFRSFITEYRDKVRKKLSAFDEQARLDVRSELRVAYLILQDRRFRLKFEAYGARQGGPDLSVAFRENQRFNLEVTRLRTTENAGTQARLANVISGKLRQLPGDLPNGLVITSNAIALDADGLAEALRLLKSHNFSAEPGLQAMFPRVSGIFVLDEGVFPTQVSFAQNREARHPLPVEAAAVLTTLFAAN